MINLLHTKEHPKKLVDLTTPLSQTMREIPRALHLPNAGIYFTIGININYRMHARIRSPIINPFVFALFSAEATGNLRKFP